MDEDDRLPPHALERLLQALKETGADAVCPQARLFGGKEGVRRAQHPSLEKILAGMCLLPNGWIMRKRLWASVGGYDEADVLRGRDDWEIWLRIATRGADVRILDEELYCYRLPENRQRLEGTLEHRARLRELACMRYVLSKHQALYDRHPQVRQSIILRSLRLELERHLADRHHWAALKRAVRIAWRTRASKDCRKAMRILLEGVLGEAGMSRLRQIRSGLAAFL